MSITSLSQHTFAAEATQTASSNPALAIARQKARYSRAYVPPPGLCRSRLDTSAATQPQQTQGASQQYTHDGVHSQLNTRTAAQPCGAKDAAQARATTAGSSGNPPRSSSAPSTGEWLQLFGSMQERQLACWRQLTQTQHQLTFELQGIRADVRSIAEKLAETNALLAQNVATLAAKAQPTATPASPRKRPRELRSNDTRADAERSPFPQQQQMTRPRSSLHPLRGDNDDGVDDGRVGPAQRRMTVHSVRLIGGSATSTQAIPHGDPAGNESDPTPADAAFPHVSSNDIDDKMSEAADSEADLFLL
ncbi:hypothetical protein ABB37_02183 [Leptomonas pyrrhocoris]|uniref:Uncharacterized protein n=1 Tax=Leptomonas pyrrhocoris TaxID=157538 RepID=A0A0N0DYG7_LEPPY|nr:hypothetical protein ABB37_02183 [Leptomonas pyrrhocoris]KPA84071.1 hypothetical protein ABB37_02183 [Leptomonas pyrrhocoris]|eukprot:XP_015662510.1 hypothetical protein ABB37_02183 [Leptomonas pyrrhocoris]